MRVEGRNHASLALWAADCAWRVLSYFEGEHPEDNRPRNAVEAGRAWARGEIKVGEARAAAIAAHAAARGADQASACAARAAGHAAATAHMAAHAAHAAGYAVMAVTHAAGATDPAAAGERERQRRRLPERLWSIAFPGR